MRLGEIKKILETVKVTDIQFEDKYGGQVFTIKNYQNISALISPLIDYAWPSGSDDSFLNEIFNEENDAYIEIDVTPDLRNRLQAYYDLLRQKADAILPFIEDMVSDQEENYINIKLPDFDDGKKLAKFISEINDMLSKIVVNNGIKGEVKFVGFDVGSDWLIYIIEGSGVAYAFLMQCLDIAHKIIEMRRDYYESEQMRLTYERAKRDDTSPVKFKDFVDDWIKDELKKAVQELCNSAFTNEEQIENGTVQTTEIGIEKMIHQLEVGAEYHPSLNPPSYVEEVSGQLKLNYETLNKVLQAKKKTPAIEDLSKNTTKQDTEDPSETPSA